MNSPFLSDLVSNFRPVPPDCAIVTLAPSTICPCSSRTVPFTMPFWASAGTANATAASTMTTSIHVGRPFIRRTMFPPDIEAFRDRVSDILHDRKERFDRVQLVTDRRRRQGGHASPAVTFRAEPGVEYGEHPAIAAVPDKPAQTLLESQDRQRHLILPEGFAATCPDGVDSGRGHWIGGRRKRQLV